MLLLVLMFFVIIIVGVLLVFLVLVVRFVDDGGRISAGSASVVIDLPDPQPALIVQTRREDQDNPKFQGTKTNVDFDAVTNSLNLIGGGNFDDITDFDTVASLDDFGGISPSGTYDFNETLDVMNELKFD